MVTAELSSRIAFGIRRYLLLIVDELRMQSCTVCCYPYITDYCCQIAFSWWDCTEGRLSIIHTCDHTFLNSNTRIRIIPNWYLSVETQQLDETYYPFLFHKSRYLSVYTFSPLNRRDHSVNTNWVRQKRVPKIMLQNRKFYIALQYWSFGDMSLVNVILQYASTEYYERPLN